MLGFNFRRKLNKRKKCQWRQVDSTKQECLNCGKILFIAIYPSGDAHFCPFCGAERIYDKEVTQ